MKEMKVWKIWILAAAFVFGLMMPMMAHAQTETIAKLEERRDIVISVSFDQAEVAVTFTSPSGDTYTEADFDQVERASSTTYYYLKNAEAGDWTASYEKGSNSSVEFMVATWFPSFQLTSGTWTEEGTDSYRVTFQSESDENESFDYEVYAVTLDANGNVNGQKKLTDGWGYTNGEESVTVSTEKLPDGTYYLMVEAYIVATGDAEINDYLILDQALSISGHTMQGDATKLITVLDLDQSELTIDWTAIEESYSECLVAVFQGNAEEPVYFQTLKKDETGTTMTLNFLQEDGDLRVVVTPETGEGYVQYERSIAWESGASFEITTPELTGSAMMEIAYQLGGKSATCEVEMADKIHSYTLTKDGSFSVLLPENATTDVLVRYSLDTGMWYQRSKTITYQNIPPVITLYGLEEEMTVQKGELTYSGSVSMPATMDLNGEEILPDEELNFTGTIELTPGDNTLEFHAVNEAGIASSRTILVHYTKGGTTRSAQGAMFGGYGYLILTLWLAVFLLLVVALTGFLSQRKESSKMLTVYRMLMAAVVLLAIYCFAGALMCYLQYQRETQGIQGQNLISVLQNESYASIEEALHQREIWKNLMYRALLGGGIASVVAILLGIIGHQIHKRTAVKQQEVTENWQQEMQESQEVTEDWQQEMQESPEEAESWQQEMQESPEEAETWQQDTEETDTWSPDADVTPEEHVQDAESADLTEASEGAEDDTPGRKMEPRYVFCTNCGARIPEGSKFCEACGAQQEEV